jgi:hypothetical protein
LLGLESVSDSNSDSEDDISPAGLNIDILALVQDPRRARNEINPGQNYTPAISSLKNEKKKSPEFRCEDFSGLEVC